MARRTDDTTSGTNDVLSLGDAVSFGDARTQILQFGSFVSALDVSHLEGPELHQLVKLCAGVDAQVAVLRSNVLSAIEVLGGDPVDVQKKQAKTSHSTAKKNAKTSKALGGLPAVKTKMSKGSGMTPGKASLLADAAKRTSADEVDSDDTLLGRVESQDEDTAKKSIEKWVRDRQSNQDRKSERQKRIDARQFWMFVKGGMVHTHGKQPADEKQMRLFRRWEAEKTRLWRLDGGRDSAHRSIRTDEQRGADAYQNVLDNIDGQPGGQRDRAGWCADIDNQPAPTPPHASTRTESPEPTNSSPAPAGSDPMPESASPATSPSSACRCGQKAPSRGEVVISARAEDLNTSDPDVMADIIGGGTLIRSELERIMCNADLYGMLFDPTGTQVLWEGRRVRLCTPAQWRALLVRDGGCVLTGADPSKCEAHHMRPFEAPIKGNTNIDELAMVSVAVHHWLHARQLTLYRETDGSWHTRPATKEEIAPVARKPKPRRPDVRPPKAPNRPKFIFTKKSPVKSSTSRERPRSGRV